jgi:predicted DNA-binding transcriptional regulator AlpA
MNTKDNKVLLRYRDLEAEGWGSRTTIWRAVKNFNFPSPIDDGRGRPAWTRESIDQFKTTRPLIRDAVA